MTPLDPIFSRSEQAARRRAHAWARYWRMMRWMTLAALVAVIAALTWLEITAGLVTIHMVIATIAGVGLTVLLGAALMLAAFMSSGSGHDDAVDQRDWEQRP